LKSVLRPREGDTNIWQYDLGLEGNLIHDIGYGWSVRPFLGAGLGARTYDYPSGYDSFACTSGYGAMGLEIQRNKLAYRAEGRSYLSCFESPRMHGRSTRSDYVLSLGLSLHLN
jgi:hypothetical protein